MTRVDPFLPAFLGGLDRGGDLFNAMMRQQLAQQELTQRAAAQQAEEQFRYDQLRSIEGRATTDDEIRRGFLKLQQDQYGASQQRAAEAAQAQQMAMGGQAALLRSVMGPEGFQGLGGAFGLAPGQDVSQFMASLPPEASEPYMQVAESELRRKLVAFGAEIAKDPNGPLSQQLVQKYMETAGALQALTQSRAAFNPLAAMQSQAGAPSGGLDRQTVNAAFTALLKSVPEEDVETAQALQMLQFRVLAGDQAAQQEYARLVQDPRGFMEWKRSGTPDQGAWNAWQYYQKWRQANPDTATPQPGAVSALAQQPVQSPAAAEEVRLQVARTIEAMRQAGIPVTEENIRAALAGGQ